jgi:hypothetical protein
MALENEFDHFLVGDDDSSVREYETHGVPRKGRKLPVVERGILQFSAAY